MPLVGDRDGGGLAAVAEGDRDAAARGGRVDGILHEVAGDQAEHPSPVASEAVLESAADAQANALFHGGRLVALADDGGELVPAELKRGVRVRIAQEGDRMLDDRLHPVRVLGDGLPVGSRLAARIAARDHSAKAGDRSLKPVDKVRGDLAQGRGLCGKRQLKVHLNEPIIALQDDALRAPEFALPPQIIKRRMD